MKTMRLMKSGLWMLLAGVVATGGLISCDGEDPIPAPEADFSLSVTGKTITLSDGSTGADSYSWDFGDGNSSTDASPTHTYVGNGSYIVSLTVTNASGEDTRQEAIEIINITIDGDLTDWDDVAYAVTSADANGTITGMKVENLGNLKLYVLVEGTDELSSLSQIFIDTDNDASTTAEITWRYFEGGEDYMIEGQILASDEADAQWFDLYEVCKPSLDCTPTWEGWNWGATTVTDFLTASKLIPTADGNAYELSLDLSLFPTSISEEGVGIAVMDLLNWADAGQAPKFLNDDCLECTMHKYTFK